MKIGDCSMCQARDIVIRRVRLELAVAFAKDLARQYDAFPATSLIDFDGALCVECVKVAVATSDFFHRERLARGAPGSCP